VAFSALVIGGAGSVTEPVEAQQSYQRISGEGSSWAANFIDAVRVNVRQFGITVDYNPSGSSAGRKNFLNGTVDFAASDIPFQFEPEDGSAPENPAPGSYAYMPVVAGGTALMYNLQINGQRVTNLRLSGENVAKIFTGVITQWNDPAIRADNPGLVLPARPVVPVVRSDGSGSTAQFTKWMIAQHKPIWDAYCQRAKGGRGCGETSFYPTIPGMISQSGDVGVAGYVSQGFAEGAIGYVNYSYALGVQFPVAKVLNKAGFYTEPTPENVAVSLLKARINNDASNPAVYLTQQLDGVYNDTDPRNYPLSSYSYFILPTRVAGQFNEAKGRTLGAFAYYAMCQAQQQSASLGYSPMPINLVEASFEQIRKIPGVVVQDIDIRRCNNPTFSADGSNTLARNAPQPQACDRVGPTQCGTGTGGVKNVPTATVPPAAPGATPGAPGGGGTPAGGAPGGASTGGATPGATPGANSGGSSGGGSTSDGSTSGAPTTTIDPDCVTPTTTTVAPGASVPDDTAADGSVPDGSVPVAAPTTTIDPDCITPTGTDAGGGTVGVDTDASAGQLCDPETGICTPAGEVLAAGGGPAGVVAVGAVNPTTLDQSSGWGSTQTLVLIVALLTLGLIFGPALYWRHLSRRDGTGQGGGAPGALT
jgi:phosphate ABC transporter phosphate-binding protein